MWLQSCLSKLMQRGKAIQLEGSCFLPSCCLGDSSWVFFIWTQSCPGTLTHLGSAFHSSAARLQLFHQTDLIPNQPGDFCHSGQPLSGAVSLSVNPSSRFPSAALWSMTKWTNIWLKNGFLQISHQVLGSGLLSSNSNSSHKHLWSAY